MNKNQCFRDVRHSLTAKTTPIFDICSENIWRRCSGRPNVTTTSMGTTRWGSKSSKLITHRVINSPIRTSFRIQRENPLRTLSSHGVLKKQQQEIYRPTLADVGGLLLLFWFGGENQFILQKKSTTQTCLCGVLLRDELIFTCVVWCFWDASYYTFLIYVVQKHHCPLWEGTVCCATSGIIYKGFEIHLTHASVREPFTRRRIFASDLTARP